MKNKKIFLNFSIFYYLVLRNNIPDKTNPVIFSILIGQNPDRFQYQGSSCSFIINGKRPLQKDIIQLLQTYTLEQLEKIFMTLNPKNLSQRLGVIYMMIKNDILIIDSNEKDKLLQTIGSEKNLFSCLAYIYRIVLYDTHKPTEMTDELKEYLNSLIQKYQNTDIKNSSYVSNGETIANSVNYSEILSSTATMIGNSINMQCINNNTVWYGWCRNLEQPDKVGIWSSADGLSIAVLSQCTHPAYLRYRDYIIETLWNRRYESGGFSNENQQFPSIEATCEVIKAFLLEREFKKALITFQDLDKIWVTYKDSQYIGGISVVYLSQLLEIYVKLCPDETKLIEIEEMIFNRATYDESDTHIKYWNPPLANRLPGSAVHTAMAIRSLLLSASARGQKKDMVFRLRKSVEWLEHALWNDTNEITYRSHHITDEIILTDETNYEHFAAPWCIMALLEMGYPKQHPRVYNEMMKIFSGQMDGLWYHSFSSVPQIWATHDVLLCLYKYMMS